ncbi:hypothetical protein KP509_23G038000 [Ceratopteris richardii]|uniref:C3H1-type domain-containing protein n=1 Tax=Ceratopteris richardii TaxID=49495 RepID=A0A8T2RZF6_CERRI|nr:hypothetical protein KP509_23G038000 [Ceratopteris richardii]
MQGLHVEEAPVYLDISISSLNPLFTFFHDHALFPSQSKQEALSFHEHAAKLQNPQMSSSSSQSIHKVSASISEHSTAPCWWPNQDLERISCGSFGIESLGIDCFGAMVSPLSLGKRDYGEVARGDVATGGRNAQVLLGRIGSPINLSSRDVDQAIGWIDKRANPFSFSAEVCLAPSLKDVNQDRFSNFKVLEDHRHLYSSFEASKAASSNGEEDHLGGLADLMFSRKSHANDKAQASTMALDSGYPQRENPFWGFLPCYMEMNGIQFLFPDEFYMYEFKVRRCMRGRSHDWTECPFAHPGEKARRRDPRVFIYSGIACPDFRRGICRRGNACELSHGVFECWLHPTRYRTQLCKDGKACKRRVCFFAHSPSELRTICSSASSKNGLFIRNLSSSSPKDSITACLDARRKQPLSRSQQVYSAGYGEVSGYGSDEFSGHVNDRRANILGTDDLRSGIASPDANKLEVDYSVDLFDGNNWETHGPSITKFSNPFDLKIPEEYISSFPCPSSDLMVDYGYEGRSYLAENYVASASRESMSFTTNTSLRTQVTVAKTKASLDQILSPTSTLTRDVFSSPTLSSPLSPSDSTPASIVQEFTASSTTFSDMDSPTGHPFRDALPRVTPRIDLNKDLLLCSSINRKYGLLMSSSVHVPSPLSPVSHEYQTDEPDMKDESKDSLTSRLEADTPMLHLTSTYKQMDLKSGESVIDVATRESSICACGCTERR